MITIVLLLIVNIFVKDYNIFVLNILALVAGFFAELLSTGKDKNFHPVILYGKIINYFDEKHNNGPNRFFKGLSVTFFIIAINFYVVTVLSVLAYKYNVYFLFASAAVFYGIATKQLVTSVYNVFVELNKGIEFGRKELRYIVSRDTSNLTENQIKISALESLAENLSDGIIAPMFYFALLGIPGIATYKLINTIDSMIGYKTEKYEYFGKFAARLDDLVNYIPSRISALLIALTGLSFRSLKFIIKYGNKHKSPNSGYPEAALAGLLNCRFGGPNIYFGELIEKPYIGENDREITKNDFEYAINVVLVASTFFMIILVSIKVL
ncbi:MAG TPA: adenosylcobinamide-phosphate synthase CbiB [Ignavibacteriales bacterium]|nr:adenosylcobinamide-phosphate synthase CbiB [Ignavibacteriales bacterium]HOL80758.1 adenosylcobinamide-phosphate synthase CbiB [Ignavibacteriales bacterium]HOM66005.1 adenosylcobinamide-phosphate synthase CbiB [Ignavibacteriales bacterium]HPP33194.1 adenosylcobinamide-phosphate synthase CbiB [Ignavibacteriales bacterium]HRR17870.1 adenosylcobinamide-phosphate synthase CbiB [Ignavibacteriales bacterium]